MTPGWAAYDREAAALADLYESLDFATVHGPLLPHLPPPGGRALDVGAGSGRDAAGLAALGLDVLAVEPSGPLRAEGRRRHPGLAWREDHLPDLATVLESPFDLVLLAGVWMHVPPGDRVRAFARLAGLTARGGVLALSLRRGPEPQGRGFHPVSTEEVGSLAADHGLAPLLAAERADALDRPGVAWTTLAFRRPPDPEIPGAP